jgi:hypothetical protein
MSPQSPVGITQSQMRMYPSIYDIPIHVQNIGWSSWILHVRILRGKVTITHHVKTGIADRADAAQNHGVANGQLLDHTIQTGQQIGLIFETKYQYVLKFSLQRIDSWNGIVIHF